MAQALPFGRFENMQGAQQVDLRALDGIELAGWREQSGQMDDLLASRERGLHVRGLADVADHPFQPVGGVAQQAANNPTVVGDVHDAHRQSARQQPLGDPGAQEAASARDQNLGVLHG